MTIFIRRSPSGPLEEIPEGEEFRNLTNVAYVDNGAPPPAIPNGNIEAPWTTFNDAQLTNPSAIYIVPGNYLPEGTVSFIPPGGSVIGMGLAPQNGVPPNILNCPLLPELDLSPPPGDNDYVFENVRVFIAGASGFVDTVTFRNCYAISDEGSNYFTFVEGGSFEGIAGGQGIQAKNCSIPLSVTCTTGATMNRFENCTFLQGVLFDVAGGVLELDVASVASMHRSGLSVTDGGVRVLDGPAVSLTWGALSANTNEFLNASARKQTAANAASTDVWQSVSSRRFAHMISAHLRVAHTNDATFTLFAGASVAALAATALTATILAGQTSVTFELDTELVTLAAGDVLAIQVTSAAAIAANSMECVVGLT